MCDPVKGYGGDYSKEQGNMRVKKWELYSGETKRRGTLPRSGVFGRSGLLSQETGTL